MTKYTKNKECTKLVSFTRLYKDARSTEHRKKVWDVWDLRLSQWCWQCFLSSEFAIGWVFPDVSEQLNWTESMLCLHLQGIKLLIWSWRQQVALECWYLCNQHTQWHILLLLWELHIQNFVLQSHGVLDRVAAAFVSVHSTDTGWSCLC